MALLPRTEAVLSRIAVAHPAWVSAFLLALTLALYLPGVTTLPPLDRDEASFAQSSRQMLASGDVIDIRLHDAPRYKKPVAIYWLQSAAAALTGAPEAIASYRLVSLVGAMLSVLATWRIAAGLLAPGPALLAGMLMASVFILGAEARLATVDAMLLASVLAAQAVLARLWLGEKPPGWGAVLGFWAALAAGALLKGPIALLVVGFTVLGLMLARRSARWLAPLARWQGLALFALLVLPWVIAITLRTNGAFWSASLGADMLSKVAAAQESHGAPPGSYLAAFWLTFWPGTVLFALSLPALWAVRRSPVTLFCLAWIIPTWLMFEAVPTKLLHYTLPVYPALALLVAQGWGVAGQRRAAVDAVALALALVVPAGLLLAVGGVAIRAGVWVPWPVPLALIGVLALAVPLWRSLRAGLVFAPMAVLCALSAVFAAGFYPGLARIAPIWPSVGVAQVWAGFSGCTDPELVATGYAEPSLVFLTTRDIRFVDGAGAAAALATHPCTLAVVEDRERPAFDAAVAGLGLALVERGRVTGTNLGSGKALGLSAIVVGP